MGEHKILTHKEKEQGMTSALTFLQRYNNEGEKLLDHFVTGGETWISYSNGEAKKQSMVQMHSGSPKHRKFKQTFCVRKLMATVLGKEKVFCCWCS
jgi:hypothetical protein